MSIINQTNSSNDWLECVKWLNSLNILPPLLKQKFLINQLNLSEFASSLRDGEILCNLLNKIIPGCIDSSQINKRVQMSQLLCLNNIRLFLNICKSDKYFNMAVSDLFDENMLYDLADFALVIKTISVLSKHELTLKSTNLSGFNLASDMSNSSSSTSIKSDSSRRLSSSSSFESPQTTHTHDDIYYNIVPAEVDPPESYYTDESFLLNGLTDQQEQPDNHVYRTIVTPANNPAIHQPLKRDFVMKEIINTEKNFLDGLKTLTSDFLVPLGNVLNEQDKAIISMNMPQLIDLHSALYNDLFNACKGGPGRTIRICNVFESFKIRLMKEYAEYYSSLFLAQSKVNSLTQTSLNSLNDHSKQLYHSQFRGKLDDCSSKSKIGKFKLTDLMTLPHQRVFKYPLLFSELLRQTDVEHSAKDFIKKTRDSMGELGNYLNEFQRDKEKLSKVEQILKYLIINNSNDTSRSSVYSTGLNLNLLKDFGHHIKDDKFRIKSIDLGDRYARTRTFFLFDKALIVCKAKGNFYHYKETLLMSEYTIDDHNQSGSLLSQSNLFNNTNLNSSLSTSSLNLNSGSNTHSLYLKNHDHSKVYLLIFKNKEHKNEWKKSLLEAKEKMKPEGQRAQKHLFEYTNFDRELVTCFVCNKYLLGFFYQGYKCTLCSSIAHKECLKKITSACSAFNAIPVPPPLLPTRPLSNPTITRTQSTSSTKSNFNQVFFAQAIYKYDGRPVPPESPPLLFNPGEIIQVTDEDDDDWWKGFVVSKNKEGYFPRRHVRALNNQNAVSLGLTRISPIINFEEYPWFSPVDRFLADAILNRIPNDLSETIFMVRCRNEGGYAISIKHKGLVDHIKINISDIKNSPLTSPLIVNDSTEDSEFTHVYSIDQQHNFNSVISLVSYFSVNLLKDNFPQLDTTLGTPFKKALPPYVSTGIARHDYNPLTNPNNTGEQIELKVGRKYFILNKEANGWWRVYNSEGLIGYVPGSYLSETKDLIES